MNKVDRRRARWGSRAVGLADVWPTTAGELVRDGLVFLGVAVMTAWGLAGFLAS